MLLSLTAYRVVTRSSGWGNSFYGRSLPRRSCVCAICAVFNYICLRRHVTSHPRSKYTYRPTWPRIAEQPDIIKAPSACIEPVNTSNMGRWRPKNQTSSADGSTASIVQSKQTEHGIGGSCHYNNTIIYHAFCSLSCNRSSYIMCASLS